MADVGAGTGLFTRLLLGRGAQVVAVEPNPEMRGALAIALAGQITAGQLSVQAGTSEATGLAGQSVGLVTAAQAAHWFAPGPTAQEFRRILRPGGRVALIWNDWRGGDEPFNRAYGQAIAEFSRAGESPAQISRVPEDRIPQFLPGGHVRRVFANPVEFSRERLYALAGSVSYLPAPTDGAYVALTEALDRAFDAHAHENRVTLVYRTHVFLGFP